MKLGRQARMDIAVACFTLISIYFILIAIKKFKSVNYFFSSFFGTISLLCHPNGLLGLISIFLILIYNKVKFNDLKFDFQLKETKFFILGLIIPLIPYLLFISIDFQAFLGQFMKNIGHSPSNPLQNLISEPIRYINLIIFLDWVLSSIFIFILIVIFIILTVTGLLYIFKERHFGEKFLFIVIFTHLSLFALIVSLKVSYWYFGIILPYWMIILALPLKNFNIKNIKNFKSNLYLIVLVIFLIINIYCIANILALSEDYNYRKIEQEVEKYIPKGSVIVGEPGYWITLHEDYNYYSSIGSNTSAFIEWDVDYILYDRFWENNDVENETQIMIKKFINENCTLIAIIPNSKSILIWVGPIKVYKVKK